MAHDYKKPSEQGVGSLAHEDPRARVVELAERIRQYHQTYLAPTCQVLGIRCPPMPSEIEASSL